jgi:sulfoxide reductase heme-binding subunit YedZ
MTLWYVARAAGFVALLMLTASVTLGALASTRTGANTPGGLDRRYLRQMAHRSFAVAGLLLIAFHATLIVLDSFVDVSLSGALIPFTSAWRPFAVGLASLALYATVATAISGAARGRLASSAAAARRWRTVHVAAYAGWALAMGHGILAGTDTGTIWSTAIYVVCAIAVLMAVATRLRARPTPLPIPARNQYARSLR